MSKKLLTETQVRRFMKLATIPALADTFVDRSGHVLREQEEDEMMDPVQDDAIPPAGPEGAGDMMAPEDMESSAGPADFDVEELVVAIADAIEGVTGVDVDVEGAGGEEEGPMDDMADMAGMDDMMGGEEAEADMDAGMPPANRGGMYENRMRNYIRSQIRSILENKKEELEDSDEDVQEEGQHTAGGEDMLTKGTNTNKDFESDDNRQSSAGEAHMGGGKAKASTGHMGGNMSGLPLEERITDDLLERVTRQVAAKLIAASKAKK